MPVVGASGTTVLYWTVDTPPRRDIEQRRRVRVVVSTGRGQGFEWREVVADVGIREPFPVGVVTCPWIVHCKIANRERTSASVDYCDGHRSRVARGVGRFVEPPVDCRLGMRGEAYGRKYKYEQRNRQCEIAYFSLHEEPAPA